MKSIFALFFLILTVHGAQDNDPFALPNAPAHFVDDPGNWMDAETLQKLERQLTNFSVGSEMSIFVVILPDKPVQGGDAYAALLGEHWDAPFWGVLLYVPGTSGSPWVAMGGSVGTDLLSLTELRAASARAGYYGRRESEEMEKIKVGVDQLVDEMEFARLRNNRMNEMKAEAYGQSVTRQQAGQVRWRMLALISGVGVLVLILGSVFLFFQIKKRRGTFEFPETGFRRRLQGQWSGGGNVLYDYAGVSQQKKDDK